MSKLIITNVRCCNENADDTPTCFAVKVDKSLKERITELASCVRSVNAYCIEEFDYSATFSTIDVEEELDDSDAKKAFDQIESSSSRIDIPMLCVTASEFYWTAVPKHCGDDLALTTERIPLSFLESDDQEFFQLN